MATLADFLPFLRYKAVVSRTWATTGNIDTVTDGDVKANSHICIQRTSLSVGQWYVTVSNGSFVVTSSDVESATNTTYNYLIL